MPAWSGELQISLFVRKIEITIRLIILSKVYENSIRVSRKKCPNLLMLDQEMDPAWLLQDSLEIIGRQNIGTYKFFNKYQ